MGKFVAFENGVMVTSWSTQGTKPPKKSTTVFSGKKNIHKGKTDKK